jgi:hypothetical protein
MYYQHKASISFKIATIFATSTTLAIAVCYMAAYNMHAITTITAGVSAVALMFLTAISLEDYRYYAARAKQEEETRKESNQP